MTIDVAEPVEEEEVRVILCLPCERFVTQLCQGPTTALANSASSLVSECKGEYGTKISALVTDIKRRTRAGQTTFKAIVFSAWNQLLHIVQKYVFTFLLAMHLISDSTRSLHHRAFTENDIAYVSLLGGASERATTLEEFRKPIDDALKRPRIMLMSLKNNEGNAYFPPISV